jgi:diguanylate cyclase (GGDEF)-like protein
LFSDFPLTVKLLLVSFLTLAGIVGLTCVLMVADHYQDARARLQSEAAAQAEMTAHNLAQAAATHDRTTVERVLASLQFSPAVSSARLFDELGRPFADYMNVRSRLEAPASVDSTVSGQRFYPDRLETYRPVVAEGRLVGVLAVTTDLAYFRYDLAGFGIKAALIATVALVVAYFVFARAQSGLLGPLSSISALLRRVLDEKRYDLRVPGERRDEIGAIAAGFNALMERISDREASLHRELAERTRAQRRLDELAHYDPLTKLPNRHYFARQLERALLDAAQSGSAGALMLIDLSDFKLVNDSLGHDAGDTLLLQLARRLASSLRESDTLCRLAGDEFALILEQISGESHVITVAEKILSVVRQPIPLGEQEARVGACIGIAVFPVDGKEAGTLVRNANAAIVRAKAESKSGYCFFSPEMLDRVERSPNLARELRAALEQSELRLHFQPQVTLDDGRLRGLEALLRWQHPKLGLLMPGDFITLAEEDSLLIASIADWTLEAACAQIVEWRSIGLEPVPICVNFAAAQLRDGHVAKRLGELLMRYSVPGELIELEITENMLMSEPGAVDVLEELRKLGARVAVANFGTGYSSLGHLKDLPINTLKIDRGFVHGVAESAKYAAITRAIVGLAADLGFDTVAEGVESTRQVEFLRSMGCRAYQGFCFSPAVPAEAAARFLESRIVPLRRSAVA